MSIHLKTLLNLEDENITIKSLSELLFVYEIDRYVKAMLNNKLCLDNVKVLPELLKNKFFTYVMHEGVSFNYEYQIENCSKLNNFSIDEIIDETNISFIKDTDEEVIYCCDETNFSINYRYNGRNKDIIYISIVAYIFVRAFNNNKNIPKIIFGKPKYTYLSEEYNHLIILNTYGNKFLKNFEYQGLCLKKDSNQEWLSYVSYRRQLGYMSRPYNLQEKFKYISQNYKVGDVFLYYKRYFRKEKKLDVIDLENIPMIVGCFPAIIRDIKKTSITIDYYPTIEMKLTRYMNLREVEDSDFADNLTFDDYNLFTVTQETFDYLSFGIDDLTYDEDVMFLSHIDDDDGSYQWFKDKNNNLCNIWLDTVNTIYAVFEDRNVKYNKENFLNRYFKDKKPLYDIITENGIDNIIQNNIICL
ncbi:hypothetical protein [Clostridioides sp. ZZV15-6597]|uniref:hypothetical protein n=1 Tax=Clostridioides sp. ZZV15-6597 TaxID=2811500 RepID=UPI001D10FFED|nr:hypothetical protein [Clostridioides sp. ZZV15-6597]HBF1820552.1 hypothetical protein [Clostridioides difficile]